MTGQRRSILKPEKLRRGDRVGVISPAGPVDPLELGAGLDYLAACGFEVQLGRHVYDRCDYLAGEDRSRVEDLHEMFEDESIRGIFCSRGGYGSLRLLGKIDFRRIRERPKVFVGYSDITALIWAIYKKTGLVTFHGPMVRELTNKDEGNWGQLLSLLSSVSSPSDPLAAGTVLRPGKAKGILIGGNLTQICHLIGTPYMPSLEGCILFLEDRGEDLYRLDRMLTHLALSGNLKGVAGVVAGDFEDCGDREAIDRLLSATLEPFDFPILAGLHLGHGSRNQTVPVGLLAEMNTQQQTLSILEPCVRE
jgi:muramoyltetrapeptide carboxypeptidase